MIKKFHLQIIETGCESLSYCVFFFLYIVCVIQKQNTLKCLPIAYQYYQVNDSHFSHYMNLFQENQGYEVRILAKAS